MRQYLLGAVFILAAGVAQADLSREFSACKAEADSLKRLTCFDAISVGGDAVAQPADAQGKPSPIVLTKAEMRLQPKDLAKRIYSHRVEMIPTFKSNSQKTVVAVEHTLTITDAFGERVVDGISKLDIVIPPGRTVRSDKFYFWDDNPFIEDEAYDRLQGPVGTGVAKAELIVTKAVFSDGTTEAYK